MKLIEQHCIPHAPALDSATIRARLLQLPQWQASDSSITRDYRFASYSATIAFVNAIAGMAGQQDHHPEMTVGYGHCTVTYTTHSAGSALSDNDFICAAKADALYTQQDAA
jgi:4a-hydroxytetrahydrobiopterin dehydratase